MSPLPPVVEDSTRRTILGAVAALADMRERHPGAYEHLVGEAAAYLAMDPAECCALTAITSGLEDTRSLADQVTAALTELPGPAASYDEVSTALHDPGVPLSDVIDLADSYASGALRETLRAVQALDPAHFRERLYGTALLLGLTKIRDALAAGDTADDH
ncbi:MULTISPECIES: hypothetical protein [unclassified Streptomyces]|uniref:hypothetical protein n=1 Tax=unclassified Streptomyces TaxID=2593676 RepID=UPI002E2D2869|nr:hypothetical protein [Streptomyces sp. NBC_00228]